MPIVTAFYTYKIIKQIGGNDYSVVYLAQHRKDTTKQAAIKIIDRRKLPTAIDSAIQLEIIVMKRLKHEHIMKIICSVWDRDFYLIVLEYCDGGDLSDYIKKHDTLSEITCRTIIQQLFTVMQYLRSYHNIFNLGITPKNIFLTTSPRLSIKFGGFDFAKIVGGDIKMNDVYGTSFYMAPEMFLDIEYGEEADLWSLGMVTFKCIFGHTAYKSNSTEKLTEIYKKRIPVEIPSGQISLECRDFMVGLLKQNPSERMSYDQVLNHPFLDMNHVPCLESYALGVVALLRAVTMDMRKQHHEAFSDYIKGLQYLIPYCETEPNFLKKITLFSKLKQYVRRTKKLTSILSTSKDKSGNKKAAKASSALLNDENSPNSMPKLGLKLTNAIDIAFYGEKCLYNSEFGCAFELLTIGLTQLENLMDEHLKYRPNILVRHMINWKFFSEIAKSFYALQLLKLDIPEDEPVDESNKEPVVEPVNEPDGFQSSSININNQGIKELLVNRFEKLLQLGSS